MRASISFAFLLISSLLTGCGTLLSLGFGPPINEKRTEMVEVEVKTQPPGAKLYRPLDEQLTQVGVSPAAVELPYQVDGGKTAGWWLGWVAGTAIDIGGGAYFAGEASKGDGTLPVVAAIAFGLGIAVDLIMLTESAEIVHSEETLVARMDGYLDRNVKVSVPSQKSLDLALAVDEQARAIAGAAQKPKKDLDSILVLNIKLGSGLPENLLRPLTELTTAEAQRFASGRIAGVSDIEAVMNAERMKEAAGCNDVQCMAEIGGMLGTRHVLAGEVSLVGTFIMVSYRLIDAKSLEVVARNVYKTELLGSSENTAVNAIAPAMARLIEAVPQK